jgi:NDP-sugar pyrophosphorylase family protein
MFVEQAVILAGGRGERLRPFTDHAPKPLVPVNGAPFLDYLIESLRQVGIRRILLLLGYRAEAITERYGHLSHASLKVQFSIGALEDQTGRRLLNAYGALDRRFVLLYGDNYWPIECECMIEAYHRKNVPVSTTVFRNADGTGEYGWHNNVEVGPDGLVVQYDKTRRSAQLNGVDIGYFIVDKSALNPSADGNLSFEEHVLPDLIRRRHLSAYVTDVPYYSVTAMEHVARFERAVTERGFHPIRWSRAAHSFKTDD